MAAIPLLLGAGLVTSAVGGATAAYGAHQQQERYDQMAREVKKNPYQADFSGFTSPYEAQRYRDLQTNAMHARNRANEYGQEWAGRQGELAGILQQRITGQRPSIAELQMQQAQQAATRQNQSMMMSQRGVNPALALRQGLNANASMQGNIAQSAGILRAQEQQAAEQQYGQLAGVAQQQALQRAALGNDSDANYLRMTLGYDEANRQARIQQEALRYQQFQDQRNAELAAQGVANQNNPLVAAGGAIGNFGGNLATIGAYQMMQQPPGA